jgi:hypothetical protein
VERAAARFHSPWISGEKSVRDFVGRHLCLAMPGPGSYPSPAARGQPSAIETQCVRRLPHNLQRSPFAIANQHFRATDRNRPTIVMFFDRIATSLHTTLRAQRGYNHGNCGMFRQPGKTLNGSLAQSKNLMARISAQLWRSRSCSTASPHYHNVSSQVSPTSGGPKLACGSSATSTKPAPS